MHSELSWPLDKDELYALLSKQIDELCQAAPLPLSALCNAAALLWEALPDINWVGFYLLREDTLYLGPFQGKVACMSIPVGRGVCGTAVQTGSIQLVKDVHQFPGHIACDSASRSELVIPLWKNDKMIGVLDIDSPVLARFDAADASGLSGFVDMLMRHTALDWGVKLV